MSPLILVLVFAFFINIPCGMIRSRHKKFTWMWFFWIHVSIPFIIYLRYTFEIGNAAIPFSITAAVFGQILGKTLSNRTLSMEKSAVPAGGKSL